MKKNLYLWIAFILLIIGIAPVAFLQRNEGSFFFFLLFGPLVMAIIGAGMIFLVFGVINIFKSQNIRLPNPFLIIISAGVVLLLLLTFENYHYKYGYFSTLYIISFSFFVVGIISAIVEVFGKSN